MVQPRGVEVPDKLEHYEGLLYGTEQYFIGEVFPYMCFENTCTRSGYETMYSAVGRPECNAYLWQADIFMEDEECAEWNFPAAGMYALNVVVNGVMDASDGTDEEKLAVRSEARMMRAYMHFLMAQFFGKPYDAATAGQDLCIPLITEASTTQTDLPRRTVEDVYDFILTEMTESVANLPDRMSHHKRVFRTAGYTMLGKVYWMMGRYEDALPAFEVAMKSLRSSETDGIFLDYPALAGDDWAISYPTDPKLNPEELYELESMYLLYHSMWPSYYGSTLIYIKPEVLQAFYDDTEDYRLSFMAAFSTGASPYGKVIDLSDQYYIDLQHTRISTNFGITTPDLFLMNAECLSRKLNERQHDDYKVVVASLHVHLDHHHCLEIRKCPDSSLTSCNRTIGKHRMNVTYRPKACRRCRIKHFLKECNGTDILLTVEYQPVRSIWAFLIRENSST